MINAKIINKKVIGTLIGNVMEFYDFIIYAFLSSYISRLFFPTQDNLTGLLMTFGVFASGYLSRPLGALFFGFLGDRYGRKPALLCSILMITLSTVFIGLLPTYGKMGIWAPFFLIICRLAQGFSVSGEQGGAVVYLSENSEGRHNGFFGALILGSVYLGVLVGSLTCLLLISCLSESDILMFGWRIPFLASVLLGAVAFWLRLTIDESSKYLDTKNQGKISLNPVSKVIKTQCPQMMVQIVLVSALAIPIYLYTVFLPTYLNSVLNVAMQSSLKISVISLLFLSIGVPLFGRLSDAVGYEKQFFGGCLLLMLFAFPTFKLLGIGSEFGIFGGLMLLGIPICFVAGPIFALLVESFPTDVRFTGVSIVFNTSMTLFGSTAPMVALYLIKVTLDNTSPSLYMATAGLLGIIALLVLKVIRLRSPYGKLQHVGT